jgi:ribonuclease Z
MNEARIMKIQFLGTGGAFSQSRMWTSFLVNGSLLFEASPTTPLALKILKADFPAITHLFITHFHGDHVMGLPFLLGEFAFRHRRTNPLHIIGPQEIERYAMALTDIAFPGVAPEILGGSKACFHPLDPEDPPVTIDGVIVRAYAMKHFDIPASGYRVTLPEGILAFSGDTGPCDSLRNLAAGSHLVILEMNRAESAFPHHLNRQAIEEIRGSLPSWQKVIITHMEDDDIPPLKDIIISADLEEYEIPLTEP